GRLRDHPRTFFRTRASQKLDHRRYCPDRKWRSRGALGCDRRRVVRSELEKWSSDVRGQVSRLTAATALSPSTTSFEARRAPAKCPNFQVASGAIWTYIYATQTTEHAGPQWIVSVPLAFSSGP